MAFTRPFAFAVSAILAMVGPAIAQESDWSYSGTFYLWAAETKTSIDTPVGTIESTLSFGDALENLDFAFMGTLQAEKGPWSIIGDFVGTNLSFSQPTPGSQFSGLDASIKTKVFNAYALREVRSAENWTFDAGAGVRWFKAESTLTLQPGSNQGGAASIDDSWFDPVLAARMRYVISDRWTGTAFIDYGGFRSGSQSVQAILTATYAINDSWTFVGGYRYLGLRHGPENDEFKFSQSGPVVGVGYKF